MNLLADAFWPVIIALGFYAAGTYVLLRYLDWRHD